MIKQKKVCLILPLVEHVRNSTPRLSRAGLTPRKLLYPTSNQTARLFKSDNDGTPLFEKGEKAAVGDYARRHFKTQQKLIDVTRFADSSRRGKTVIALRRTKCISGSILSYRNRLRCLSMDPGVCTQAGLRMRQLRVFALMAILRLVDAADD